jgi:hypothetical protein
MDRNRPHAVEPTVKSVRVAFVYKANHNAPSHVGLGVTASGNARVLRKNGFWAEVWPSETADEVASRLRAAERDALARGEVPPTHVIVNAPWIETKRLEAMAGEFPPVTFVVVSHSNWGFLAADPHAVKLMREGAELQHTTHNVRVAGNCTRFVDTASEAWSTALAYLPNLYDASEPMAHPRGPWPGDSLRVGLFGACRILKNGVTAAAAVAVLANTLRVPTELHVSERDDGGVSRAIDELVEHVPNLKVVSSGWLPWTRFRRLVGHMHLLLQPSFTESFNVVTADGVHAGVPSVVSPAVAWAPSRWQADPDDAGDVARVAEYLLRSPGAIDDGRRSLQAYVAAGVERWRAFLAPPAKAA